MLVKWNQAESMLNNMVCTLFGLGNHGDILVAHMGNVALKDAMATLSFEFSDDVMREHIAHFLDLFDRVREWRNYYVHGIVHACVVDGEAAGFIQMYQARGKLALTQQAVTACQIRKVAEWCEALRQYGGWINLEPIRREGGEFLKDEPPLASRDKPPLPDRLTKPRVNLLDGRRRPLS